MTIITKQCARLLHREWVREALSLKMIYIAYCQLQAEI